MHNTAYHTFMMYIKQSKREISSSIHTRVIKYVLEQTEQISAPLNMCGLDVTTHSKTKSDPLDFFRIMKDHMIC